MKTCTRCKQDKETSAFGPAKANKDGLHRWCKPCVTEYAREYREKNPEKRTPQMQRDYHLKRRYGITSEQFDTMLSAQNGTCATCDTLASETTKSFHVDHDHSCCPGEFTCGKCVRGLLCFSCNMALGYAQDNIERLENMIKYLSGIK